MNLVRPSGVVLFGPPAAGKDAVTTELERLDGRFAHFRKLKVGGGRKAGYRMSTASGIEALAATGQVVSRVSRYGNEYVIDEEELHRLGAEGRIPVVHTADFEELAILAGRRGWESWLLWVSKRQAEIRLTGRHDGNNRARLDLRSALLRSLGRYRPRFDRIVDTSESTPLSVARELLRVGVRQDEDLALAEILSDPDLIVPVVTLRDQRGGIDWGANEEYARRAQISGTCILVGGTTGDGHLLTRSHRDRLREVWLDGVGPGLVIVGHLDGSLAESGTTGARPLLIPPAPGYAGLSELAQSVPGCVAYCKPSLGSAFRLESSRHVTPAPFALKLSGTTAQATGQASHSFSGTPRVWHGSSSSGREALDLGADALVAAPLAAAIAHELPTSWHGVLDLVAAERWRGQTSLERSGQMTERVRRMLEEE